MGMPNIRVPLVPIHLVAVGVAADNTTADRRKAPWPGRVHDVWAGTSRAYGTTPHTDVDITVKKGATDLLTARIAATDASTPAAGGLQGSLVTVEASLTLAAGDILNLDVDITGGSSPLTDCWATVWVERFPG
jgi:hypothetical protein